MNKSPSLLVPTVQAIGVILAMCIHLAVGMALGVSRDAIYLSAAAFILAVVFLPWNVTNGKP